MSDRPPPTAARLHVACTLALALLAWPASARARDGDEARALLERTQAFYAGHSALGATLEQVLDVPRYPQVRKTGRYAVVVDREGPRLALRRASGQPVLSVVVAEGRLLAVGQGRHVSGDAPGSLSDLPRDPRIAEPFPALPLVIDLARGSLVDPSAPVESVVDDDVDGRPAHRVRFAGHADLWIAAGEQPWVLRWTPAPPDPARLPEGVDLDIVMRIDVRFSDWTSEPALEGAFPLEPPEGSVAVASLGAVDAGPSAPSDGPDGHGPRGEKPLSLAPDVTLATLDGRTRKLSELRGRVVVLDFWATWCKPCIRSLPILDAVVDELSPRGVSLFAIDVREPRETVEAFLAKRGFDWPVVLDPDGAIAAAYGVRPIPHTVIVGRDGRVVDVHVGYSDGLEKEFRKKLLDALAK